ncbi:hypothetical protein ZIOFF_053189 [Zingiber officinale]|uniref:BHLH domain-containing protein n=2 Tax=Zingiber officinale TaxID=94328 RepID=A0A8J5KCS4_ZINOF|nr:hypothetical protein ZIOFF_053189 [Zingiber officinale]
MPMRIIVPGSMYEAEKVRRVIIDVVRDVKWSEPPKCRIHFDFSIYVPANSCVSLDKKQSRMMEENGYYEPDHGYYPMQPSEFEPNDFDRVNLKLTTFTMDELSNTGNLLPNDDDVGVFDMERELQSHMIHEPSLISDIYENQVHDMIAEEEGLIYSMDPHYSHINGVATDLNVNLLTTSTSSLLQPLPPAPSSFSFNMFVDPLPQSRVLFHSLPQNYGAFYGLEDEREVRNLDGMGLKLNKGEGKSNFATERQRREQINEKYKALRLLIPNPTKVDRASIVGDAIEYIKELLRTVEELRVLVDKKRQGTERIKIPKLDDDDEGAADMDQSSSIRHLRDDEHGHSQSGPLRSSWLQRRSKESLVDVRIVDDDANVKLTTKRKAECLLRVALALEELRLDVGHVAGGNIGVHYVFMFSTKIPERSSVYAGAIAKKILEAIDST